jgi:hypothetical protein
MINFDNRLLEISPMICSNKNDNLLLIRFCFSDLLKDTKYGHWNTDVMSMLSSLQMCQTLDPQMNMTIGLADYVSTLFFATNVSD